MRAAFTKEVDFFAERGVEYVDGAVTLTEPNYFARQMFDMWGDRLGITEDENDFACRQGFAALRAVDQDLQRRGLEILEKLEEDNRVGVLLLGRPYHLDPGLNHGVLDEFQALGYPVLSIRSSIHPSDIVAARQLRRYVREYGPFDVVHGHSSKGGAISRLATVGSGASVFYTMHGLVVMDGGLPDGWDSEVPRFDPADDPIATRKASQQVIQWAAAQVPNLVSGSADLEPSTLTLIDDGG